MGGGPGSGGTCLESHHLGGRSIEISEFEASLGYYMRHCLITNEKQGWRGKGDLLVYVYTRL